MIQLHKAINWIFSSRTSIYLNIVVNGCVKVVTDEIITDIQ